MRLAIGALALAGALAPGATSAATYKCVDPQGKITYQEKACPPTASEKPMKLGTPGWQVVHVRNDEWSGETQVMADLDNVQTVDEFKRVKFKEVRAGSEAERRYDRGHHYFHYFDCVTGKVSRQVHERSDTASVRHSRGFWSGGDGHDEQPWIDGLRERVCRR